MSEPSKLFEAHITGSAAPSNETPAPELMDQKKRESLEENLERLAALNLSNDPSLQPRFSTAVIRLVSALTGAALLVLIYFIFRLFV